MNESTQKLPGQNIDPESMRDLQSQIERVGLDGKPIYPRLRQNRAKQQEEPDETIVGNLAKKKKWVKWLPWVASGTAAGGTLAATYFDWLT